MKVRQKYRPPIAMLLEVEDDEMLSGSATTEPFNKESDGFDEDTHSTTDWFNDNAGDGFDENTSSTADNFNSEKNVSW